MNNFTYENTKNATHFGFAYQGNPYFYVDMGSSYEYTSKHGIVGVSRKPWLATEIIELSRPHNETHAHWTTNGVTQYAQPQGNKMDTSKMIPISYVRKFTPLVVGDEIYAEGSALNRVNALECWNDESYRHDVEWFLVSFADRPNEGTQPVGDDVVVDVSWGMGPRYADVSNWRLYPTINNETWKPNHAAMLAKYQAEQLENVASDRLASLDEDKLISHADMVAKFDTTVSHEDAIKYMNSKIKEINEKPVFTQAMADAGELLQVNTEAMGHIYIDGRHQWEKVVSIYMFGKECAVKCLRSTTLHYCDEFKPIQTDEDKLRDAIMDELNCDAHMANNIMFASKFTITLKG